MERNEIYQIQGQNYKEITLEILTCLKENGKLGVGNCTRCFDKSVAG